MSEREHLGLADRHIADCYAHISRPAGRSRDVVLALPEDEPAPANGLVRASSL